MAEQYWTPNQIRFTQHQVKWLVGILPILRDGEYPPSGKESGYVDPGSKHRQVKARAKFIGPAEIAAELDNRITNAGADGLLLEFYYSADAADLKFRAEHIATALNLSVGEITQRIRNAMSFVSGARRKRNYAAYLADSRKHGRGSYRRR